MKFKTIALVGALALGLGGGLAWKVTSAQEVGVSKVSANPGAFVGKLKIVGKTGGVDAARGLFQMVDEKGCCNLVVAVPTTAVQGTRATYAGTMPRPGQPVEAHGVLRPVQGGYQFDVTKVTSSGELLLKRS
ncbi:MAG: hypothetical protein HY900_22520 [Deltaproteobacteria bacterium]|nr:hypothetical protein [Deltaproteobacteria bacterium]